MRRGFTLIEVMVAVAILGLVGTLVYQGFAQTALNKARVETDVDFYRTVNLALERMAREISMAYVSTHVNPALALQVSKTTFLGTDSAKNDRIDFTSFSHRRLYRGAHESDQNEISYFVTDHPDDPGIQVLARREDSRIDEDPEHGGRSEILVEGVEEFELEYYDPLTSEWLREWDAVQPLGQPNRLPTQVRIRLVVQDPRDPDRTRVFGTRTSLPMTHALNHANYNP